MNTVTEFLSKKSSVSRLEHKKQRTTKKVPMMTAKTYNNDIPLEVMDFKD
jgi:hypothetical protein